MQTAVDFRGRRQAVGLLARLGTLLAAGGLAASEAAAEIAAAGGTSDPATAMIRRPVGSGGETLAVVGLGTYRSFDVGSSAAVRAPLAEVLRLFVAGGGQLVDSSPMYGEAESVVGDLAAAEGLARQLFFATKVWTSGRASGVRQMEESFRRLRVPTIDLMQVHNLLDLRGHLPTLQAWKKEGRLRYLGITHYHAGAYDELSQWLRRGGFDFVQFNYSLAEREAEARLLPLAADVGAAVIVNRPFAQAGLFAKVRGAALPAWSVDFDCASWAHFFLKYIIAQPAVTCVIPATGNPLHLLDNLAAGVGRLPDATTRRKMVALVESL